MAQQPFRLPKKDQETFRDLVSYYETKQYRKGIKAADQILAKFPNHGETLAMKGLVMNATGKKTEAYELIKSGLKNDLKSHVCWHVYGLVYKSDSNYKEASKCFLNALRADPENQNILRDLSWLQVQVRDIQGFFNTRNKILTSKPQYRVSWVGFAVAHFLAEDYQSAFDMLSKFYEVLPDRGDAYEESELLLFQNRCLEKQGRYSDALAHLNDKMSSITDKYFCRIKIAEYNTLLGHFDKAVSLWTKLVIEQGENYRLHAGLQTALLELDAETSKKMFELKRLELPCTVLPLTDEQLDLLNSFYREQDFRSRAVVKIVLSLARGEKLREQLDKYLKKHLHSGIPSLFQDICSLICHPTLPLGSTYGGSNTSTYISKDPIKFSEHFVTNITLELLESYIVNLKTSERFESASTSSEESKEVPTSLLWAMFLKSHLLEMSGRYEEALVLIDECIEHTPTALDMYLKKARILKDMGAYNLAADTMDKCRALDLQDRYLNNKATKYLLRAGQISQALDTIAMFTKHDGDPQQILFDLQCNWYELEAAEAYAKNGKWGLALKKFYAVQKHFIDYYEDMFDFHAYCMRKTTLRMYADILIMQDQMYSHKFYQRALRGALRIMTHLLDHPEEVDSSAIPESVASANAAAPSSSSADKEKATDDDPHGNKLLKKDFLAESAIWCSHILPRLHVCQPETLAAIAEIMTRRQKYVLALRALRCGLSNKLHPDVNVALVKLAVAVGKVNPESQPDSPANILCATVEEELAVLMEQMDLKTFVFQYVDACRASSSLAHAIAATKCVVIWGKHAGADISESLEQIFEGIESACLSKLSTVKDFAVALKFAEAELSAERQEALKQFALRRFPTADFLKTPEARAAEEIELFSKPIEIADDSNQADTDVNSSVSP